MSLSALALELARILRAEGDHPPLSVETLQRVMLATGFSGSPWAFDKIESALAELMQAGAVEATHSARLGRRFRVQRRRGDMSEPETAA